MHKSLLVSALLLLVAASTSAQSSNTVSVFVSNLAFSQSTIGGATIDSAYGASFDHRFGGRFSGELSVTSQRVRRYVPTFTGSSQPTSALVTDRLYPIDATVSYHFLGGSRWKPYIGAGLRYVNDTFQGYEGFGRTTFYRNAVHTIDGDYRRHHVAVQPYARTPFRCEAGSRQPSFGRRRSGAQSVCRSELPLLIR
jgi:outer membrane protein W